MRNKIIMNAMMFWLAFLILFTFGQFLWLQFCIFLHDYLGFSEQSIDYLSVFAGFITFMTIMVTITAILFHKDD